MGRKKITHKILSHAVVAIIILGSLYQLSHIFVHESEGIDIAGGHISTNTTWIKTQSPYRINGVLVVDFGFILTIEPGVRVEFSDSYSMYIEGDLQALGTSSEHIMFTSAKGGPAPGDWNSIRANSTGHVKMNYCDISYGTNSIYLFGSSDNIIENTTVSESEGHGIFVRLSSYTSLRNSDVHSNMLNGVYVLDSSYTEILDSKMHDNSFEGLSLSGSSFINVSGSQFHSNEGSGIHLFSASHVILKSNIIPQNLNFGITMKSSNNVEIINSEVLQNWEDGIFLSDSSIISIDGCTIYDQKNGIYMSNASLVEVINSDIYDNKEGGIVLVDSSNNIFDNLDLYSNKNYGIYLTEDPIFKLGSSSNSVSNTEIWDNLYGVFIRFSQNNSIEDLFVHGNSNAIVAAECDFLTINNSNISNNDNLGISLVGTANSLITNNELFGNEKGIFILPPSKNNLIHHNSIKEHVIYSSDTASSNQWDDGSEGNYWGDYDGLDSDSNGIGDDPYLISPSGQDRYPLVDFYNTVFKILNSDPANEATLVPVSSKITLFLSESAVTQTFVNNITITPANSILSYTWQDSDKTLILGLSPMNFGEYYTLTVNTNAQGTSGRNLKREHVLIFYTENPGDSTPPKVMTATPTGNNVPIDIPSIDITFTEGMHRGSTESAFSITPWVEGSFAWTGNTMHFIPAWDLVDLTKYTVKLDASSARDVVGYLLDGDSDGVTEGSPLDDYFWQFTAFQEDLVPPTILNVEPTGSSVDINSPIRIYFSELMNRTSVENAFSYNNGTTTWTSENGTWGRSAFVMTFIPDVPFNYGLDFNVTLLSSAFDLHQNTLDGNDNGLEDGSPFDDYTWSFRTILDPALGMPKVMDFSPTGLGIDIATEIEINFSQEMNQESVEYAFSIFDGISTWNSTNVSFIWEGTKCTIIPGFTLSYNTVYFVKINISAKNVFGEQLDGNENGVADDEIADSFIGSFKTKAPSDIGISFIGINGQEVKSESEIWPGDSGDIMQIGVNVTNFGFFSTNFEFNVTLRNVSGQGEPLNITYPPLVMGQDSGTKIFSWTAPTTLGDHFVEIIVDWDDSILESIETNNRFVLHFAIGPDYSPVNVTVNGFDASDPSLIWYVDLGTATEIGVQTKNVGFSGVASSITYNIAFWNSTSQGVIQGPSAFQMISNLPGLESGESSNVQLGNWYVPNIFSDYYVTIITDYDDSTMEIDEGNNMFTLHFTFSSDYTFKNINVDQNLSNDPEMIWNATTREPVSIGVNVSNFGLSGVDDTVLYNLSFYNSTNRGTPLQSAFYSTLLPGLLANEDSGEIVGIWIPPDAQGDFYVSLIIDPLDELQEENENNNIFVLHFRIGPDIVVSKIIVNGQQITKSPSGPIYVGPLDNVSIELNISNLGFSGSGGDLDVGLFNGTRGGAMNEQPFENLTVSPLKPLGLPGNDSGTIMASWLSARDPGTYYVVVYADISHISSESDENNNLWILTFVISPDISPNNITANGVSISSFDHETVVVLPGQSITLGANISNIGSSSTGSVLFGMALFNSTSGGLNIGPQFWEINSLGPINENGFSSDYYASWTAPYPSSPADYYINISVDHTFRLPEVVEGNNHYIIHIRVDGPDLTPDEITVRTQLGGSVFVSQDPKASGFVSSEITLPLGWDLIITYDVVNIGGIGQTVGTNVSFYNTSSLFGAANATPFFQTLPTWIMLDGKNTPLSDQTQEVGQTILAQWTNPNIPGIWYVNITIDLGNNVPEFNEGNNIFTLIINVTDFPATTLVPIGPSYSTSVLYVNSTTELELNVTGGNPVFYTWYRVINETTNVTVEDWKNYTAIGSSIDVSWGEGTYRIEFNSTDSVGNVELKRYKIVVVDGEKPQTQILIGDPKYRLGPSDNYNITSSTSLLITASDLPVGFSPLPNVPNASGISTIYYRIQNLTNGSFVTSWTLIQKDAVINLDGSQFTDGLYRIWFNSTDNLHHKEAAQFLDVYLDNRGPKSVISVGSPKQPHTTYDWFVSTVTDLTVSSSELNGSGVNISSIQVLITYLDGGISSSWILDSTFDIYSLFWQGDGNYTIEFRALDNLGNIGTLGAITVYSDDSPPEIGLVIKEPKFRELDSDLYNLTDATPINLTGYDGPGSGKKNLEYRIFNLTYDSGWTVYFGEFNLSGLNPGRYSIEFMGIDNLGNFQVQGTEVYLDTIAPVSSIAIEDPKYRSVATDLWNITSQTSISLTFALDIGSGPDYLQYRITNATYDSGWIDYSSGFFLDSFFSDGEYSIFYRGFDRLGNVEVPNTVNLILDNSGPSGNITLSGPVYGKFVTSVTLFTKNADDGQGSGIDTIWHRIYGNDTGFYYTGWLPPGSFSLPPNLIEGNYKIEFFATDNLRNSGPMGSILIYLDKTAPGSEITVSQPRYRLRIKDDWVVTHETLFTLNSSDGSGSGIDTILYSIINNQGDLVVSSASYTGPFNVSGLGGDGKYTILYQAVDNLGHLGSQNQIMVIMDSTSPQITSSQPSGSGNSISSFIRIIFSEEMDHDNVMYSFSYTNGSHVWDHTDGFFNWNKNTMTFYPFEKLQYITEYTVTLNTTATDIMGNRLDGNADGNFGGPLDIFTMTFITSERIDKEPPTIINVTPYDGSEGVQYDSKITIEFSEIMDEISVEAAFRFSDGTTIFDSQDGTFQWIGNVTTFTPFELFKFNTQYTMTVSAQAKDIFGNYMTGGFTWRFTTESDFLPPEVIDYTPTGDSVLVDTKIFITFNEPMNSTLTDNAIIMVPGINGSFIWDVNTLVFTPDSDLKFSTHYIVTVGIELKDIAGNSLELPFQFEFKTEPDHVPPEVTDHFPKGAEIGLDTQILISFNEVMNRTSVEEAFSISPSVNGVFSWEGDTLIFQPDLLHGNTVYTITVSVQAADVAGNALGSPYEFSFTTKVDPDPPLILEVAPLGEDVDVDSDIVIRFNEPMKLSSLQPSIIIVPNIAGFVSIENDLVIFSPTGKLTKGTIFNVTILNTVEDIAGNRMVENYSWEFTTEESKAQTSSPMSFDVLLLTLFMVAIVVILVLVFFEFVVKKKKKEDKTSDDGEEELKDELKITEETVEEPEQDGQDIDDNGDPMEGQIKLNDYDEDDIYSE